MKPQKSKLSHATHADRTNRLKAMAKELHNLGYEPTNIGRIKQKHIGILVKHWQESAISVGTIKNRLSDLRFVCHALNRNNVVKPNDEYNIGKRCYIPSTNKAIHAPNFSAVENRYVRCSIELQRVFGLRREECLKIIPSMADNSTLLRLKGSWTKGGVPRAIPIRTSEQRYWLDQAKKLSGKSSSLVPKEKTYIQQRRLYDRLSRQAGFKNLHGLRHAYAQRRYVEITGWNAPINGGKDRHKLSKQEQRRDQQARKIIALELGHSRMAIAKNYLG